MLPVLLPNDNLGPEIVQVFYFVTQVRFGLLCGWRVGEGRWGGGGAAESSFGKENYFSGLSKGPTIIVPNNEQQQQQYFGHAVEQQQQQQEH